MEKICLHENKQFSRLSSLGIWGLKFPLKSVGVTGYHSAPSTSHPHLWLPTQKVSYLLPPLNDRTGQAMLMLIVSQNFCDVMNWSVQTKRRLCLWSIFLLWFIFFSLSLFSTFIHVSLLFHRKVIQHYGWYRYILEEQGPRTDLYLFCYPVFS